jgi:WD40 repeat protein
MPGIAAPSPLAIALLAASSLIAASNAQNKAAPAAPAPTKAEAAKSPLPAPLLYGTPVRRIANMPVTAAYNRDGSLLLATCIENIGTVFDTKTGRAIASLQGEGLGSNGSFCGAKQERVVVAFQNDGVRLYETRSGKQLARLADAGRPSVSPDGLTIAVGKGSDLLLLDAANLKPKATIKVGGNVLSTRYSPDGQQILVGLLDGNRQPSDTEEVVDVAQKKVTSKQPAPPILNRVIPLPDGKHAVRYKAIGLAATNVERFELPDGPALASCKVPLLASAILLLGDGSQLVAADTDGRMVQVEFATGALQRQWNAHDATISRLVSSPDGKQFVSICWDGVVRFWDVATGEELYPSPQHNQSVYTVAFGNDNTLVSGAADGTVIRWAADGKMALRDAAHEAPAVGLALTAAGLWSASVDTTIRLVDATGTETAKLSFDGKYEFPLCLAHSADGTLVSGHRDGTVQWRNGKNGNEIRRGDQHTNGIQVVACNASGTQVISGGVDGFLVFWEPEDATPRAKVKAHKDGVRDLCMGANDEAWSCGAKGELKRWNAATGELISTTTVGDADTRLDALAWSAKAGLLVVASRGSLHCLALADLRHLGEVKLPANCLTLASSPDGNKIAAGLSDGRVALFDLAAPPAAPAPAKPGTTGPKR